MTGEGFKSIKFFLTYKVACDNDTFLKNKKKEKNTFAELFKSEKG